MLDTANPFVQLLSGVVWLIRNGSIYINESLATECDETQETGQGAGHLEEMQETGQGAGHRVGGDAGDGSGGGGISFIFLMF